MECIRVWLYQRIHASASSCASRLVVKRCPASRSTFSEPKTVSAHALSQQLPFRLPVPALLKQEVEEGVRRYAEIQKCLKQISGLNVDLLEERKKR